jgi:hypothetical protein
VLTMRISSISRKVDPSHSNNLPSKSFQAVTCIREMLCSNFYRDTDYTVGRFCDCPHFLQANSRIVLLIRPQPYPSTYIQINYELIILSYDAM